MFERVCHSFKVSYKIFKNEIFVFPEEKKMLNMQK